VDTGPSKDGTGGSMIVEIKQGDFSRNRRRIFDTIANNVRNLTTRAQVSSIAENCLKR
jgi:hypothetical protein